MGKAIYKELQAMAATLPKQLEPWSGTMRATGSALIASGANADNYDSNTSYKFSPGRRQVNHFKRMKRAYQKGGFTAVNKYIDNVQNANG